MVLNVFIDCISIAFSIVLYPTKHIKKQYLILYLSVWSIRSLLNTFQLHLVTPHSTYTQPMQYLWPKESAVLLWVFTKSKSERLLQCHASRWFTCPSAIEILLFLSLFAVTPMASFSGCFTWNQPLAKQKEIRTLQSNFCWCCLFFSTVKPCAFHPFLLAHTFDVVALISGSKVHTPLISCHVFSKIPT